MEQNTSESKSPYPCMSGEYRHPFGDMAQEYPLPANERNMNALSAAIRAKASWWTKITDPAIRTKWKEEAVGAPVPYGPIPLTEEDVEYTLNEVQWQAARRDARTGIEPSVFYRIWQSDSLVDDMLRTDLLTGVARLEDVPAEQKDWHPRSNGQVLDLVHPSLHCIVYGRTLHQDADGAKPLSPPDIPDGYQYDWRTRHNGWPELFVSARFSWLPTDFSVSVDGDSVKAQDYINNLDPFVHAEMYPIIERLVARFVPLWERVLAESRVSSTLPDRTTGGYDWIVPEKPPRSDTQKGHDNANADDDADGSDDSDAESEHWHEIYGWDVHRNHTLVLPKLKVPFSGHPEPTPVNLKGRNIQIIVKLANIHLTPEKPQYTGGSWHVEGMMNEAIISTGIYYYDEENITESALAFRSAVSQPGVWQDDSRAAVQVYGINRDEPLNQEIGAVATKQGHCIAFPNVYQHQVQPFELVDKSKPGHRKIIVFFLVDPALESPRPSTSNVPPQQENWMRTLLVQIADDLRTRSRGRWSGLGVLPVEVLDMIVDQADWLMTREEAESVRLELMDERGGMIKVNNDNVFCPGFNLCEH